MQRLVEGYRLFVAEVFPAKRSLYESLAGGQHPQALFLTCSDSRVDPLEFTGAEPGDLFVGRSLGNIVPEPGGQEAETNSIIEYAVVALGVEHIIVCGHSRCGAVKALLEPSHLAALPTVAEWLTNAGLTREDVLRKHGPLEGDALWAAAVRDNVLVQMDRVRRQPSVETKLAEGRMQVHGWVFEFEHGRVVAHDPRVDRFVSLDEAYGPATV